MDYWYLEATLALHSESGDVVICSHVITLERRERGEERDRGEGQIEEMEGYYE